MHAVLAYLLIKLLFFETNTPEVHSVFYFLILRLLEFKAKVAHKMLPSKPYFKIFNLKPIYNINKDELKKSFYKLSKVYHPDTSSSDNFHLLNSAYRTLNNDLLRAKYLTNRTVDVGTDFLIELLGMEEEVDRARNLEELDSIKKKTRKNIQQCMSNWNNSEYVAKWVYFERLMRKIETKALSL